MAEETAQTTGTEETNEQGSDAKDFEAITSQEEFDKRISARIVRERSKFTDYDDLKAKAEKFAAWENEQKTEAEKVQERLAAAEKRAVELELTVIRATVAAAKGVPVDLLSGSTQEELEAAADALIAFRGEPAKGPVIPSQGRAPQGAATSPADSFARFMEERLS